MVWLRAIRWRLLLPGSVRPPLFVLFKALLGGFFASFILPLRVGELVRPWLLSRWQPIPFATGLASVVTERVFDATTLFTLFGLCVLTSSNVPDYVLIAAGIIGGISLLILLLAAICYFFQAAVRTWVHGRLGLASGGRYAHAARKIVKLADEFLDGLGAIKDTRALMLVIAWSFAIWLSMALWYQAALWACGQYPSLWVGMKLNVIIALAVAAPSAPGFVGTYEAGSVVALSVMGPYSREFAMAYSVLTHGFQLVVIIGAGLVLLHYEGLRLRELAAAKGRA
jgi:uncharacterized protein (TIRG00374 family)